MEQKGNRSATDKEEKLLDIAKLISSRSQGNILLVNDSRLEMNGGILGRSMEEYYQMGENSSWAIALVNFFDEVIRPLRFRFPKIFLEAKKILFDLGKTVFPPRFIPLWKEFLEEADL